MKKATIIDIAKKLNISTSTVSRALSDHSDVSQKTKDRVKALAEGLNYQPNIVAQNLKRGHANIIGVLVPQVRHFFFAEIMAGISEVIEAAGYSILISQSNEKYENEVKNVNTLIQQQVAGLLISVCETTREYSHFELLKAQKIPFVFFDRACLEIEASKVIINDFQSAYKAVDYLIKAGYRRIAHLAGFSNMYIAYERLRGYQAALTKNGMEYDENLVIENGLNEEDGAKSFIQLFKRLDEKPDAIFAVNDPVALGAFREIKKLGLKIPDDIALVGFSDNPVSSMIEPALTTIKQPAYEIGREAALILLNQIKNKKSEIVQKVLPTELIKRQSA